MTSPTFQLTKKIPITLHRRVKGSYVNGIWVDGATSDVVIEANVQPMKDHELMLMPEAERSKEWLKVYSASEIRAQVEGTNGWDSDEFEFDSMEDGKTYIFKIMKVRRYKMSILDHWRAIACRKEITPG